MKKNIVVSYQQKYIGKISLKERKRFEIEAEKENKELLEKIIASVLKEGLKARRGAIRKEKGGTVCITYLTPIDETDPLYLEAVAEAIERRSYQAIVEEAVAKAGENRPFQTIVLNEKRAQLYILIEQSQTLEAYQKKAILRNIRSFSEKEVDRFIQVLSEEKEGITKIEKEYQDKLRALRERKSREWNEMISKQREKIRQYVKKEERGK